MTEQEVAYRKIQAVFNPTGEKFGDDPDPEPDYPDAA